MTDLQITLLGHFDIMSDGASILTRLEHSNKSISLIKYLLLHRKKAVPVDEIIEIFWPDDKTTNPENALKTMISRIRSSMAEYHPDLRNCILSRNRAYQWNGEISCTVDVEQIEHMACRLEKASAITEQTEQEFTRFMTAYPGDISRSTADEHWVTGQRLYYHHLYLKTVYRFIELLKNEARHEDIIHICRLALDIDSFDEQLNVELIYALQNGGRDTAALGRYNHVSGAYSDYFGVKVPGKIKEFYQHLIYSEQKKEADIAGIRQELRKNDETAAGPVICEYSVFRDIYQLQMRNMERQTTRIFIALISVDFPMETGASPLRLDHVMRSLLSVLQRQLRKGDIVARYSPAQYAILLPMLNYTGGQVVINRIKEIFYREFPDDIAQISFQCEEIE